MMPEKPEQRTHDYLRHGTTSLFAAFNTEHETVISSLHPRHRTVEFQKFLQKIDSLIPDDLDMHLVCDNYATHKRPAIRRRLEQHPHFQVHHTPTYSSQINQIERSFAYLTDDLLRRTDHRSVQALQKHIRSRAERNQNPKPFI
jgi:transposase